MERTDNKKAKYCGLIPLFIILIIQVECLKSRMDRLKKGCAAVSDYNEEVGELIIWLKEFEPKLNISVQLDSTDPKEIKNLQGNLLYC